MTVLRKAVARYSVFHGLVRMLEARHSVGRAVGRWEGPGTYEFRVEPARMTVDHGNWTAVPVATVTKVPDL